MKQPAELRMELALQPLPTEASLMLQQFNAPPRLVAHLLLVHDIATQLLAAIQTRWTTAPVDASAVLLGSAWHDIGKIRHPDELTGPGHQHETAGMTLLTQAGVASHLARFAETHGQWSTRPDINLDDLIVALADTCWKGKRDAALETKIIAYLASVTNMQAWEIFVDFDTVIERLAKGADARLAWQNQFAVE